MARCVALTLCGPLCMLLFQRSRAQLFSPRAYGLYHCHGHVTGVIVIIRLHSGVIVVVTSVVAVLVLQVGIRDRALPVAQRMVAP